VENFFKEMKAPCHSPNGPSNENDITAHPVIDNILVKLDNVLMSRAVMTLAGSLQVQVKARRNQQGCLTITNAIFSFVGTYSGARVCSTRRQTTGCVSQVSQRSALVSG